MIIGTIAFMGKLFDHARVLEMSSVLARVVLVQNITQVR